MDKTARMRNEFELRAKTGEEKEKYAGFISAFEADTETVMAEVNDYLSKNR